MFKAVRSSVVLQQLAHFFLFINLLLMLPLCAQAGDMNNLRGQRYCEIILAENRWTLFVYNTIGLNDCPGQLWNKMNTNEIQKQTKASWVHLNGPRYWVIDGMKNATFINRQQKVLGQLSMREAGILHLGLSEIMKGAQPYLTHTVHRQTTWIFKANRPVFELINPQGHVFVMQSYSIQKTPQTEASLSQLGAKLKLPAGWRFRTGNLSKDVELPTVDDKAIVIQDNFSNTYQQASKDFLG